MSCLSLLTLFSQSGLTLHGLCLATFTLEQKRLSYAHFTLSCPLPFSSYKTVNTSFPQLVIWFWVTFDEMKQELKSNQNMKQKISLTLGIL